MQEVLEGNVTIYEPQKEIPPVNISGDIEYARGNLVDLIELGKGSVQELAAIADQSQHPTSYVALSNLINTLVNANEKILNLEFKRKEIEAKTKDPTENKVINNNLIVTSEQLLRMIKEKTGR
jgi:hypothetical protein